MNNINNLEDHQLFYIGQKVIAVDAIQGSNIKNGTIYTVYDYHMMQAIWSDFKWYWYIGVECNTYKSHKYLKPSIFAPIIDNETMEGANEQFIEEWNKLFVLRKLDKIIKTLN